MYGEGRGGEANLRALDKATGKETGKVRLPAQTNTAPMTFLHDGRQYHRGRDRGCGNPGGAGRADFAEDNEVSRALDWSRGARHNCVG
jgi:hypothetical protein